MNTTGRYYMWSYNPDNMPVFNVFSLLAIILILPALMGSLLIIGTKSGYRDEMTRLAFVFILVFSYSLAMYSYSIEKKKKEYSKFFVMLEDGGLYIVDTIGYTYLQYTGLWDYRQRFMSTGLSAIFIRKANEKNVKTVTKYTREANLIGQLIGNGLFSAVAFPINNITNVEEKIKGIKVTYTYYDEKNKKKDGKFVVYNYIDNYEYLRNAIYEVSKRGSMLY